jgi:hypothetical protein
VDLLKRVLIWPAMFQHFPAGGYKLTRHEAGRLKAYGLEPGMPDLMVWYDRRTIGLELKSPTGRRSQAQRDMHPRLIAAGVPVYLCRTPESVVDALWRECVPMQPAYVRALLDRPYEPAERILADGNPQTESRRKAKPTQSAAAPAP